MFFAADVTELEEMFKSLDYILKPGGTAVIATISTDRNDTIRNDDKWWSPCQQYYAQWYVDPSQPLDSKWNDGVSFEVRTGYHDEDDKVVEVAFREHFHFLDTYQNVAKKSGFESFQLLKPEFECLNDEKKKLAEWIFQDIPSIPRLFSVKKIS